MSRTIRNINKTKQCKRFYNLNPRIYIFDLDGTIIDSSHNIEGVLHLVQYGGPVDSIIENLNDLNKSLIQSPYTTEIKMALPQQEERAIFIKHFLIIWYFTIGFFAEYSSVCR